jgi:hypothetical protein
MLRLNNISHDDVDLTDWLCWKKQDCGLQELREWIGNEAFLRLLSLYPGLYLKLPPSKELVRLSFDLELAKAVYAMKVARKTKDLAGLVVAEQKIYKIAKHLDRPMKWAKERGLDLLKEIAKVSQWKRQMMNWRKRNHLEV